MAERRRSIHTGHRQRVKDEFSARGLAGWPDHRVLELLLYYTPEEICWAAGRLHVILHVEAPGVTRIPADLPWAQRRSDESANA